MSDYSEQGAVPVEDAATDDPPTVDEVLARQRAEHPEQAATSTQQPPDVGAPHDPADDEAAAAVEAGGRPVGPDEVEGPNPA
jgi:hypothetical protein